VLITTLLAPYVLGRLRRRWAYTLGVSCFIAASLLLASFTVTGQVLGTFVRNVGTAIVHVTLSLYILDNIKRSDLARAEPIRLSLSVVSWTIGPMAGVYLYDTWGPWAPQVASISASALLLAVFWWLRLADPPVLPSANLSPFNPLANVQRFVQQPRLRLAWVIAFGRSCFWSAVFIYGPLLMIEGGLGKQMGGYITSASQAVLATAFLFGRLAQKVGVRKVITWCLLAAAATSMLAGWAGKDMPLLAGILLVIGALAATGLDGVGGIPYLRAVRPHERQRMTAVYRTFIDFSELVPGFVFAIVLSYFEIGSVFVILGLSLLVVAGLSWRYLPKSL
jgi:MFS family permease